LPLFLQFRLWLSQGPARERALAAVSAALVIVLLVLASLPLTDDNGDETVDAATGTQAAVADAAPGTPGVTTDVAGVNTPGATSTGGTQTGTTPTGSAVGSSSSGAAGTPTAAAGACTGLTNSAPGITAKEVLVDVSMVDLAGPVGNTAFNIRPDLHDILDAVVDDINKTGGVACGRKLVTKRYDVNPIDQNDQQSSCLQMVQDKPFLAIDQAGYITPVSRSCFVQNKLPLQISTSAATHELKGGYPYLYGQTAPSEKQGRDGALGLAELGFFAPPKFQKLGLMEDSCEPDVNAEIEANLAKVGVKPNQISKFTLGCALIAPPNEILQGVLQHKSAGATHVFLATSISNSQRYTQLAAQQNFKPTYGTVDYGTNTASVGDWDASFVNALAISSQRSGDLNSGIRSAGLQACDRVMKAHGLKGIETERNDGAATGVCDAMYFFRQAISKAGANPTRQSFIEGVSRMGRWTAAGSSDGLFDRPGKVVGGDFHRTLRFDGGCTCWKVQGDPAFKPGF
jgi:hypothetical protein